MSLSTGTWRLALRVRSQRRGGTGDCWRCGECWRVERWLLESSRERLALDRRTALTDRRLGPAVSDPEDSPLLFPRWRRQRLRQPRLSMLESVEVEPIEALSSLEPVP